jgi:hypothetical protein
MKEEWLLNSLAHNFVVNKLSATSGQISSHPTKLSKEGKLSFIPCPEPLAKHVPEGLLM